jgi:spermidine synthase
MHLNLLQPVFERLKGATIIHRVRHDNPHRALVVGLGDGLEALLAGRVPDLHADLLAVDLDGFDFEVDA